LQALTAAVDFGRVVAFVPFYQIWTLLTGGVGHKIMARGRK